MSYTYSLQEDQKCCTEVLDLEAQNFSFSSPEFSKVGLNLYTVLMIFSQKRSKSVPKFNIQLKGQFLPQP